MPSIWDWAAQAAKRIVEELRPARTRQAQEASEARVAAIIATFAQPLLELVQASRRGHYHCDDSWYCCGKCTCSCTDSHEHDSDCYPASHDGEAARTTGVCNCGADAWNARVDAALAGSAT